MADFSQDLGSINEVIVPPDYDPNVEEPQASNLEVLDAVVRSAADIYTAKKTGDLRSDLTQGAEQYISEAEQSGTIADQALDNLPQAIEQAGRTQSEVDIQFEQTLAGAPTVVEARGRLSKLQRAVEAGNMNSGDFKVRAEAMMRQYINQSPGLSGQLRKVYAEVMGDYNVILDAYDAQAKSRAKASAEMWKRITDAADEMNLDPTWTLERTAIEVSKRSGAAARLLDKERQFQELEVDDKLRAIQFKSQFTEYMADAMVSLQDSIEKIIDSPDFKTPPQKANAIDMLWVKFKNGINAVNKGTYDNAFLEAGYKPHEQLVKLSKSMVLQEVEAKYAKDQTQFFRDAAMGRLLADPEAADLMARMQAFNLKFDLSQDPRGIDLMINVLENLRGGAYRRPAGVKEGSPEAKKFDENYYGLLQDMAESFQNPKLADRLTGKELQSLVLNPIRNYQPGQYSHDVMEGMYKHIANPAFVPAMEKAMSDDQAEVMKSQVNKALNQYLTGQWLRLFNGELATTLKQDVAGVGFSPNAGELLGVLEDEPMTETTETLTPESEPYAAYIHRMIDEKTGKLLFVVDENAISTLSPDYQQRVYAKKDKLDKLYAPRFYNMVKAKSHLNNGYSLKDYVFWAKDINNASIKLATQQR